MAKARADKRLQSKDAGARVRTGSAPEGRDPAAERARARRTPEQSAAFWAERGDALLAQLAAHGATDHEVRADLRQGRFVWLDPTGRVSAEARARVLCSLARATNVLTMAWADPLVRAASVHRVDGMAPERDGAGEADAWRAAMAAADASGAEVIYRLEAPDAWYFLALDGLTFAPVEATFAPGSPVRAVLHALAETRAAVVGGAEPADVVRGRLDAVGAALRHQASFAYRGTDWVARLEQTSARLAALARRLPRPSYRAVAAGHAATEWLAHDDAAELASAIGWLEDEWRLFGGSP
jgi:hypothetical protein